MYGSTRKDDAMGSKSDVVALFKISALGIKSRQQNIETQTSPIGIKTLNENAQSSAQMSPGFSMTCKYKQNFTNLCFLFNPAGLFKQLDTHHIQYFVYQHMCAHMGVEVKEQLGRSSSVLPPCGSWHQAHARFGSKHLCH